MAKGSDFAELLGEVLSASTAENFKRLVAGEAGANRGKKEIAVRSKKEGQDAVHDAIQLDDLRTSDPAGTVTKAMGDCFYKKPVK